MIQRRACRFRLYPTPAQAQAMAGYAGACRFVYNLALEQRRDWYRPGRKFSYFTQARELTELRVEYDWIKAVPVHALQQALKDLDRAYQNWWAGRAAAPRPRRKGQNDSFRLPDPAYLELKRTGARTGMLKLPKLGWVKLRGWRKMPGDLRNVTITRHAGQWFASIQCERDVADPAMATGPAVGIDLGVSSFATLSNGDRIEAANHGRRALTGLDRAQRDLARKVKGSRNRLKAVRRVARVQQRIAYARKDFLHKASTAIAKSHGMAVLEELRVRNMTASAAGTLQQPGRQVRQKAGLNRAILDQGWGMFRILLAYKLAERGAELILVNPGHTSQECPVCRRIDPASRPSQAVFRCTGCGHADHADQNAARNILARGLQQRRMGNALQPVEGHRIKRPDEAGTTRRAA